MTRFLKKFFILLIFVSTVTSCESLSSVPTQVSIDTSKSRILVYFYMNKSMTGSFTSIVNSISLKKSNSNQTINLLNESLKVTSKNLSKGQFFVGEYFIEPGDYSLINLSLSGKDNVENIKSLEHSVNVKPGESRVINLKWDLVRTGEKGTLETGVSAREDELSTSELLMYVSNSDSNYISVIDGAENLVVGAVTVGMSPKGMALNSIGTKLYILNSQDRTVTELDPLNLITFNTYNVTSGSSPENIVFFPTKLGTEEGKLYITNSFSNNVTVTSLYPFSLLKNITVGENPVEIELNLERNEVYVVNEMSNEVSIISTLTDVEAARIAVCLKPVGVTVVPDDFVYVFCESGGFIQKINPSTRSVESFATLSSSKVSNGAYYEETSSLYVTDRKNGNILRVDDFGSTIFEKYSGAGAYDLSFDSSLNKIFVVNSEEETLSVFNLLSDELESKIIVGKNPYKILRYGNKVQ